MSTTVLVVSVVVTLLVYWLAEEYAEVVGEQVQGGRLPSRASIWEALAATWPMVTASYAPLLALVLAHLAGASDLTAANVGLAAAIVLLTVHGWLAGRAAQLRSYASGQPTGPANRGEISSFRALVESAGRGLLIPSQGVSQASTR